MEECGASSQGLDICTQEKSIITPTNGGGGGLQNKSGETEKKTRARKMTHTVQSSVSLMESINNVTSLTLLLKERIISRTHGPFFLQPCFNRRRINAKQMFGNMLMISCVSGTDSLCLSLSRSPPGRTRRQFTFSRVRLFYINRRPLWREV